MKKILIINTNIFNRNGMSTVVMNYYQCMDRSNKKFDFISNEYMEPDFKKYIEDHEDKVFMFSNRKKFPIKYFSSIRKIIKKNHYDVIHIHTNSSTVSIELLAIQLSISNAKVILHAHGVTTNHPYIHKFFKNYVNRNIDIALASSDKAGKFLFTDQKKFKVIKNGINTKKFEFNEADRKLIRKKLNISDDTKLLVHVAAFSKNKNHDFLIELCNEMKTKLLDFKLILIGTGELEKEIQQLVNDYSLMDKVIFLGSIQDIEKYYSASDIFLLPSIHESFGIVAIEAQANGLPCLVSTALPRTVKLTDNIEFLSIERINFEIWIEKIKKLKRNSIDSVNNWTTKEYEITSIVGEISELYEK